MIQVDVEKIRIPSAEVYKDVEEKFKLNTVSRTFDVGGLTTILYFSFTEVVRELKGSLPDTFEELQKDPAYQFERDGMQIKLGMSNRNRKNGGEIFDEYVQGMYVLINRQERT